MPIRLRQEVQALPWGAVGNGALSTWKLAQLPSLRPFLFIDHIGVPAPAAGILEPSNASGACQKNWHTHLITVVGTQSFLVVHRFDIHFARAELGIGNLDQGKGAVDNAFRLHTDQPFGLAQMSDPLI